MKELDRYGKAKENRCKSEAVLSGDLYGDGRPFRDSLCMVNKCRVCVKWRRLSDEAVCALAHFPGEWVEVKGWEIKWLDGDLDEVSKWVIRIRGRSG